MSQRNPVIKQLEPNTTEATALSLTPSPLLTSGQAEEEQSIPMQRRIDERNKSSPTHTRNKSARHTEPQYPTTSNQALRESFAISEPSTGPASLTSPINSPTCTTAPSLTLYSSLSTEPANRTINSSHKPHTSPQPSLDTCMPDTSKETGACDPQPPKIQQSNETYIPSNRNPEPVSI